MRIQHNIPAMNSYRNYTKNVSNVSKNLEKLSTGYKINRAGDDAAGLAISEKMRIQITGLERAQSNAKSGINLVQTAEGALTEVHDMLNRMYDLAEQSANGTYDNTTDRKQLQKEVDALRSEIDRIADGTNYNGIKLLDGSMENKTVTSGATDVELEELRDGQLEGKAPQPGIFSVDLTKVSITNNDSESDQEAVFTVGPGWTATVTIGKGATLGGVDLAYKIAESLKADNDLVDNDENQYSVTAENGVLRLTMLDIPKTSMTEADLTMEFTNDGSFETDTNISNQGNEWNFTVEQEPVSNGDGRVYAQSQLTLSEDIVKDGGTLTIGKETYVFAIGTNSVYKDYANVVDLTDKTEGDNGSADLLRAAAGRLTKVAAGNESFFVGTNYSLDEAVLTFTEKEGGIDYAKNNVAGEDGKAQGLYGDGENDQADDAWSGLITYGNVNATKSTHGLNLQIGDTAESFNKLRVSISDMHADALGLTSVDISTQEGAQAAMEKIKNATNMVSDVRGGLGALQNRLDHTINSLSVAQENIQDSEATIRDVDVAAEMMNYTKNNILVQSAQAMLAQANQLPQGVLQLLG